ncbi:MAG: MATE family efflux transporter, partial [Fibrobacterota bacterium]
MSRNHAGVQLLLGEPKRAVRKLSAPIMFAMFIQTVYNIVDGIWVSGIPNVGDKALAAIGVFFPFFMTLMAFAGGIGVGGGATISRKIGEDDTKGADHAATLTFAIALVLIIGLSLAMLPFLKTTLTAIAGDKQIGSMAWEYGRILILSSPLIAVTLAGNAVLRGEGDSKRAMICMSVGSLFNIIADPLLIYTFDMGYRGAALATALSFLLSSALCIYWIFIKKNTHVTVSFAS